MNYCMVYLLLLSHFVQAHLHQYSCVFDDLNQDLREISSQAQPDIAIHSPGRYLNGRLLSAPTVTRAAIRITLQTSAFNATILPPSNGASSTTSTNLNFLLKTMMVTQSFYQKRLQVGQVALIKAPDPCVDFQPSADAQNVGYTNTDLLIFVQYLTDKAKTYGATGKSCKYLAGTTPDLTLQTGRPTVGRIIFNTHQLVDQQTQLTNRLFQSITSTALHETMHILGFDSTLYLTYLDPATGSAYLTPPLANASLNGNRPASTEMTTPFVLAWAQSFFGCANLTGMPLENEDSQGLGGGSHWERVAMYDELMTGTALGTAKYFSGLSFALLKDTGWYSVDDSFAQTSNYGYQQGCSFLQDACYGSTPFPEFCDVSAQSNISYCSSNFIGKALCSNQAALMADGCGIYGEYFSCIDPGSPDTGNFKSRTLEVWGSSSFCVASTMNTGGVGGNLQSRCYPYACNPNSITFTIGTYTLTCLPSEAGSPKTLSSLTGSFTCPNYTAYCTMSRKTCSSFCSQNGYCMGGVCNCYPGYSGSDCSKITCSTVQYYDSASNSCIANCPPSSGYYNNQFSFSCLPCQAPCSLCLNSPTYCTACLPNYNGTVQYYYSHACSSSCPISTYVTGSNTCAACDTSSARCLSCSLLSTNCTSCQLNYYLLQPISPSVATSCEVSCPSNFQLRDIVDPKNLICRNSCLTYQIQVNDTCVLCSNSTYKQPNGSCSSTCPNSYYPDNTYQVCNPCDTSCENCDGSYAENCTSCSGGFLLLKICMPLCPKGFYPDTSLNQCALCPSTLSCSACAYNNATNSPYCTSCIYGYFFVSGNSTCGTSCLSSQYKNTWNNSCSNCNSACSSCNGPTSYSCTSCPASAYLLTNATGSYCLSACPAQGYVLVGTTQCKRCDSSCSSCSGVASSQCNNCSNGLFFSGGYCRYVCPNGTYPNATTASCASCDATCSYCFGGNNASCTSCRTGLYLYNFTCAAVCPQGLSPNQWNMCFEGWQWLHQATYFLLLALLLN